MLYIITPIIPNIIINYISKAFFICVGHTQGQSQFRF